MARETTKTMSDEAPEQELPGGALPGQITAPNPVEVFWEKHKLKVWALAIAAVAVYGASRWWEYRQRQARNQQWSAVTNVTGIRTTFDHESMASLFNPQAGSAEAEKAFFEAIAKKNASEFEAAVQRLPDSKAKALAFWYLARSHAERGEVEATKAAIAKVAEMDKDFIGLVNIPAPPRFIEVPEIDPNDPSTESKQAKELREKPPLPAPGKIADQLIAMAEREAAFKKAHPELSAAPEPAEKPIVTMETSLGTIVLRLYPDKAPKHVEQFLKNVEAGVYDGLSFHRIARMGNDTFSSFMFEGKLAYLGDPETKQDDRTKWGKFKSETVIGDERSGISHFPFMLASEWNPTLKGSDTQVVFFTASDAAEKLDEKSVVFGRVVEGQDVVSRIADAALSTAEEIKSGSGIPATAITVEKVSVQR